MSMLIQKKVLSSKITPAHDFNDFMVGKKHNLEFVNIFNKNAELNQFVPRKFLV